MKIVEGVREDRINRDEPIPDEPDDGALEPPYELREDAQEVWDRLAPQLVDKGVMTAWDVDQFASFCTAAAVYRECNEMLGSNYTEQGAAGGVIKSPYWQIMRDAEAVMSRIGSRFGLTPADRASLKVGAEEEKPSGAGRLLG